jgi:hypothetical protein
MAGAGAEAPSLDNDILQLASLSKIAHQDERDAESGTLLNLRTSSHAEKVSPIDQI